jgi:3-hydroxybutyryl-CoA dehydrogenase
MSKENLTVGVVGLGLMGSSISAALLMHDQRVIALSPIESPINKAAPERIAGYLKELYGQGFIKNDPHNYLKRITYSTEYESLEDCDIVLECVLENLDVKNEVYERIEKVVSSEAIITSNTSAIPINILQENVQIPRRFFGMHWAEPAFTTRFLEIICGDKSDVKTAERLYDIASSWGKEPTLVRKDIRGFITNRLMYAMFREAFYLVENDYATVEDVDRACRNDAGHWITFCGVFRFMDISGLQAYYHVMKDLFPTLNNQTSVPALIEDIATQGGRGISNGRGFYDYTKEEAKEWEAAFQEFSFEISRLAAKYPSDIVSKRLKLKADSIKINKK